MEANIRQTVSVYADQLSKRPPRGYDGRIEDQITSDPNLISWSGNLKGDLERGKSLSLRDDAIVPAVYRPFCRQHLYFDRQLNERVYQFPRIFPTGSEENRVICVTGAGAGAVFSSLMVDCIPNFHTMDTGQCFPLRLYEAVEEAPREGPSLLDEASEPDGYRARDAINDAGLRHFQDAYPGEAITKEDVFYYIYGLLHSEDYRARFANNLSKELPRIPCVTTVEDFRAFRDAGRRLGDLHVNYESAEPYPVTIKQGDLRLATIDDPTSFFRVTKMKFGGRGRDKDKTTVVYNANITMENLPLEAYEYVVNGKPALEWVMERQVVKTDKASGIANDANRYAVETVDNPAYPLELFQRIITVSLETTTIVRGLPKLEIAN